jgi:PAS domain S-box-containing protein
VSQKVKDEIQIKQHGVTDFDGITDPLKNILDNSVQGILFIDTKGVITTCNHAAEMILGLSAQEVLFHTFWDIFSDDMFGFSVQKALKEKQLSATYHVSYFSPSHHHRELEVVTTIALKGMMLMIHDVTEVHRLQILAARTDRMKILGEMAAHVAHEIRNPLGGIKGFASLLKRDLKHDPELEKMADYIIEGTDNLSNLVNQILHYTRPIQLHLEKIDLITLLHQVKQHLLADVNIYKPTISIIIDSPFDTLILPLDGSFFKSAILNLLVNAIQAMPKGGMITLRVRKQSTFLVLSVEDTGTGIPEEDLSKLFSPFFTTKPEGNGLGLPEVQKVVQAHNGTLDVISIVDKGTTFTIKLPYSS